MIVEDITYKLNLIPSGVIRGKNCFLGQGIVLDPEHFIKACEINKYDAVFLLPPWKAIFTSDNERYENFEQSETIHSHLADTYTKYGYNLIEVPFGTIKERVNFILQTLDM